MQANKNKDNKKMIELTEIIQIFVNIRNKTKIGQATPTYVALMFILSGNTQAGNVTKQLKGKKCNSKNAHAQVKYYTKILKYYSFKVLKY